MPGAGGRHPAEGPRCCRCCCGRRGRRTSSGSCRSQGAWPPAAWRARRVCRRDRLAERRARRRPQAGRRARRARRRTGGDRRDRDERGPDRGGASRHRPPPGHLDRGRERQARARGGRSRGDRAGVAHARRGVRAARPDCRRRGRPPARQPARSCRRAVARLGEGRAGNGRGDRRTTGHCSCAPPRASRPTTPAR